MSAVLNKPWIRGWGVGHFEYNFLIKQFLESRYKYTNTIIAFSHNSKNSNKLRLYN